MPEAFPYKIRSIPMTGRLIEAIDPLKIGENFRELKNLRPTETHKEAIGGITKITSTAITFEDALSRPGKIRNSIHFVKEEPYESHLVMEVYNYAENALRLYELEGDIPSADTWGAALYTIAAPWVANTAYIKGDLVFPTTTNGYYYECIKAGTSHAATEPTWPIIELNTVLDSAAVWVCRKGSLHGSFSLTNSGALIYANNHKILIWYGDEHPVGAAINSSKNSTADTYMPLPDMDTDMFDVTDKVNNTLADDENVMLVTGFDVHVGGNNVSHYDSDVYIGSPVQISGAKFYIQNPIGYTSATTTCDTAYWKAGGLTAIANTDGTSVGSKTLSQTGSINFTSDTVGLAEPILSFGRMLYWYRFRFHSVPLSTNRPVVYFITTHSTMQPMTDIWDGTPVPIIQAWLNKKDEEYIDRTINIATVDDTLISNTDAHIPITVMRLNVFAVDDLIYFGSFVRLCGFKFALGRDKNDSERNRYTATMQIESFNGTAFTSVSDLSDGTSNTGRSFWQSGIATFTPTDPATEFKTCVKNDVELYYYRVHWNHAFSGNISLDQVLGIPAPVTISGHSRAFTAQGRLFLTKGNSLECSPVNRPMVMNGSEHTVFDVGEETEVTGGCQLFNIQGSDYWSPILAFKKTATHLLTGTGPSWQRHDLSNYIGLAASDTLCVFNPPKVIPGISGTVAIGQGTNGVFICDGRPPRYVSDDIEQYFDSRNSACIPAAMLDKSVGFPDYENMEYHWLFASGSGQTTLNKEYVLNLEKMEWYEVDRASTVLQFGVSVADRYRKYYSYGFSDAGYVYRLEYGNDFDGDPIECVMWSGDLALYNNDMTIETKVEQMQLMCVAKETTDHNISYDHYLDTSTTAMNATSTLLSPKSLVRRVANIIARLRTPAAIFHSGKFTFTCHDEVTAFEPLVLMYHFEVESQKVRPTVASSDLGSIYIEGV
jgi:hypothetical protein